MSRMGFAMLLLSQFSLSDKIYQIKSLSTKSIFLSRWLFFEKKKKVSAKIFFLKILKADFQFSSLSSPKKNSDYRTNLNVLTQRRPVEKTFARSKRCGNGICVEKQRNETKKKKLTSGMSCSGMLLMKSLYSSMVRHSGRG